MLKVELIKSRLFVVPLPLEEILREAQRKLQATYSKVRFISITHEYTSAGHYADSADYAYYTTVWEVSE